MVFNFEDAESAWRSPSLYIGDLAEDTTEAELYEIFSVFGRLDSVKVCRNWDTGSPLGYGFINFLSVPEAENALNQYNFKPIRGKPCRLMWSTKRSGSALREEHAANIFIKGLSKQVSNKTLFDIFSQCGNVLSSRVAKSKNGSFLGYGYVSFASDDAADLAIRSLNKSTIMGQKISVERFVEKSKRAEKPWSNVHISGIPFNWTRETLIHRFSGYGSIRSAVIMTNSLGHSKGFGFIDFDSHISAKLAVQDSEHPNLGFDFADPVFSVALVVTAAARRSQSSSSCSRSLSSGKAVPLLRQYDYESDFFSLSSRRTSSTTAMDFNFQEEFLPSFGNATIEPRRPSHNHKFTQSPFSEASFSSCSLSVEEEMPDIVSLTQELQDPMLFSRPMEFNEIYLR